MIETKFSEGSPPIETSSFLHEEGFCSLDVARFRSARDRNLRRGDREVRGSSPA